MDFLAGGNDLGTLGLGLVIAGAVAGLVSGVLGYGAGLILVPALFLAARGAGLMPGGAMALAIGTSFACLVPLSLARAAATGKAYDRALGRKMLAGVALAIAAATTIAMTHPRGDGFVFLFAAVALASAILTVVVKPYTGGGPRGIGGQATGFVCALLASLTGTGGSALFAPALLAWGSPRDNAQAMAAAFAIPITVIGALAAVVFGWSDLGLPRYSYGYVNLLAFGVAAPVAFVTSMIGTHYADLLETQRLRWLVAAFIVFSAARMVWSVVG